jgi:hypothetical protein
MIVTFAEIITDVEVADALAELFDKINNTLTALTADVGMTGVQGYLEFRKAL